MNYELSITSNLKPHIDIQRGLMGKKDGLYTFTIRVDKGNIVDYAVLETITIKDYQGVTWSGWRESGVSYHSGEGSPENAVRPDKR
jgi:hypothetical protein